MFVCATIGFIINPHGMGQCYALMKVMARPRGPARDLGWPEGPMKLMCRRRLPGKAGVSGAGEGRDQRIVPAKVRSRR